MNHPLQALLTAREVAQGQRDAAWAALVAAQRRLAQTLAQGQALASYRQETQARYRKGQLGPQGAEQLHTVYGFTLRLDDALRQQAGHGELAMAQQQHCHAQLVEAERRLAVLDKLLSKRQHTLRLLAQRREQRAEDERAARMATRQTGSGLQGLSLTDETS